MRTELNPRITNTESLYRFRKNHQKKRINKLKKSREQPSPIINCKIVCTDGIASLGNITEIKEAKYGVILGKGMKSDMNGRCPVILVNMTKAYFDNNSPIVMEKVG